MINYGELSFVKTSVKDGVQDKNPIQIKLKLNDTYKKDEELTTNFWSC